MQGSVVRQSLALHLVDETEFCKEIIPHTQRKKVHLDAMKSVTAE
jgi:hypothetical protein